MGQTASPRYDFEGLPLDPVEPGTSLLVTGPSIGGTRELCMELLRSEREGVLLLSADLGGGEAIEAFERAGVQFDPSRMGILDATQHGETDADRNVCAIGTPADLTGMGMHYARLYEELHGAGVERVRTGLYTLTTILPYVDDIKPVYRFLHTLTGPRNVKSGVFVELFNDVEPDASRSQHERLNRVSGCTQCHVRSTPNRIEGKSTRRSAREAGRSRCFQF